VFYTPTVEFNRDIKIPYNEKPVVKVKNLTTGLEIPFDQRDGEILVTIDTPASSDSYGGEHIAEVFELIT